MSGDVIPRAKKIPVEDRREWLERIGPKTELYRDQCNHEASNKHDWDFECDRAVGHSGVHVHYNSKDLPKRYWVRSD